LKSIIYIFVLALLLASCGEDAPTKAVDIKTLQPKQFIRKADFATVQKGLKVYRVNCAKCHGSEGQGAPNWQQAGADGKYPAPPLNGTGHAWHHPMPVLVSTIKDGTQRIGGKMPPWRDKLTDADISAVIAWFQSRWPGELYEAWARMDREASK